MSITDPPILGPPIAPMIYMQQAWNWLTGKVDDANTASVGMVNAFEHLTKVDATFVQRSSIYASNYVDEFGDLVSQNDVAVLVDGAHLSGEQASLGDKVLAGVFVLLPISGSKVKLLSGAGGEVLQRYVSKFKNQTSALDQKHITAAIGDIQGNPIVINGRTYDHLDEVSNALRGLGKKLDELNVDIEKGAFSGEVLESAKGLRTSLQKQKDQVTDVLNRTKAEEGR